MSYQPAQAGYGQPGMQQGMQPGMQGMQGMPGQPGMGQPGMQGMQGMPGQPGMGMGQPGVQGVPPGGMMQQGMQGMPGQPGMGQPGMMQPGMQGMPPGGMKPGMPGQPGMMPGQPGYAAGGPGAMYGGAPGMGPASVFQQPTTFQVKQNFFAAGGQMDIMQNGMPYFRCVSTPSPLGYGHSFSLTDMNGNTLCNIQPDMYDDMPHFQIFLRGVPYATLKQDWTRDEKKFELHNKQTGERLKVYGDWFGRQFEFQRHHGGQVATISPGYGGELYDVTVYPGEDALFILAAALCIEKVCHEHKHHHRHNW